MTYDLTTDAIEPDENIEIHETCTYVRLRENGQVGTADYIVKLYKPDGTLDVGERRPAGSAFEHYAPFYSGSDSRIAFRVGQVIGKIAAVEGSLDMKQYEGFV